MTARFVHYVSSGNRLAFDCYYDEVKPHIDAFDERDQERRAAGADWYRGPRRRITVPAPLRHTNLRKVTCPECWAKIREMANNRKAVP